MEQTNSNSIARDFSFRFLFRLQGKHDAQLLLDLKGDQSALMKLITDFHMMYRDSDKELAGGALDTQATSYANQLIIGVIQKHDELKAKVESILNNRKIGSIDQVDLTILLLGTFEITFVKSTPFKVAMNEYIELAKKYGRAESKSFINGVLDSLGK